MSAPRRSQPLPVALAADGVLIHAVNHLWTLFPIRTIHPGTVFHAVSAPLYAWLVYQIRAGRKWARVAITVLLGCQFAGRFVIFAMYPDTGVRLTLLAGWLLSLAILALLWLPRSARAYFA